MSMGILNMGREQPKFGAEFTLQGAAIRRKKIEADVNDWIQKGNVIKQIPGFERTLDNPDYTALRKLPAAMGIRA